jgi:hypothetical protein
MTVSELVDLLTSCPPDSALGVLASDTVRMR